MLSETSEAQTNVAKMLFPVNKTTCSNNYRPVYNRIYC